MINKDVLRKDLSLLLEFLYLGCFKGFINSGAILLEELCYLEYERLSVLLLGDCLWMAALGIEQNKAQNELQQAALEKQQHCYSALGLCSRTLCVHL